MKSVPAPKCFLTSGHPNYTGSRASDTCQDNRYSQARTTLPSTRGVYRGRGSSGRARGWSSFGESCLFFPHRFSTIRQDRPFFPQTWHLITMDSWVLKIILGFSLEFTFPPV